MRLQLHKIICGFLRRFSNQFQYCILELHQKQIQDRLPMHLHKLDVVCLFAPNHKHCCVLEWQKLELRSRIRSLNLQQHRHQVNCCNLILYHVICQTFRQNFQRKILVGEGSHHSAVFCRFVRLVLKQLLHYFG